MVKVSATCICPWNKSRISDSIEGFKIEFMPSACRVDVPFWRALDLNVMLYGRKGINSNFNPYMCSPGLGRD